MADDKRRGIAVIVTDAAVLAYIRETGIANPDEIRNAIALVPGLIGAAKMGRYRWTVDGLTFLINAPGGGVVPAVTGVVSGPSDMMTGAEMSRARYRDRGSNHTGRRNRSTLNRKPKGTPRPARPPTEKEYDDVE